MLQHVLMSMRHHHQGAHLFLAKITCMSSVVIDRQIKYMNIIYTVHKMLVYKTVFWCGGIYDHAGVAAVCFRCRHLTHTTATPTRSYIPPYQKNCFTNQCFKNCIYYIHVFYLSNNLSQLTTYSNFSQEQMSSLMTHWRRNMSEHNISTIV